MTRKQRINLIFIILSLPIFAGDIILVSKGKLPLIQVGIPFALTFAIFIGLWFFIKKRDGQKVEGDERSMKIAGRACSYSWLLTLYVLVLFILNRQLGIIELSIDQYLFYVLAVLLASFWIFKIIFDRRGDLE